MKSTKKLLELISEFSKVTNMYIVMVMEHGVNVQKSIVFPYTSNEWSEIEILKQHNFTIKYEHLEVNLTKDMKDLYTENYKILLTEMKEDLNKWRDISCSWAG